MIAKELFSRSKFVRSSSTRGSRYDHLSFCLKPRMTFVAILARNTQVNLAEKVLALLHELACNIDQTLRAKSRIGFRLLILANFVTKLFKNYTGSADILGDEFNCLPRFVNFLRKDIEL